MNGEERGEVSFAGVLPYCPQGFKIGYWPGDSSLKTLDGVVTGFGVTCLIKCIYLLLV